MKNKRNKGFSLIELITTIATLAILTLLFVPSLWSSSEKTKENADKSALDSLMTTMQMAAQTSNIYKDGHKVADLSNNNTITFVYAPNDNFELECVETYVTTDEDEKINEVGDSEQNLMVLDFKEQIVDYINGSIEPIIFSSDFYRTKKIVYVFEYPDVDLKVNVSWSHEDIGTDDFFNWPNNDNSSNLFPD